MTKDPRASSPCQPEAATHGAGGSGHAGRFLCLGRRAVARVAGGFLAGVGLLFGLHFAATVLRAACVSMQMGGFGG